MSRVKDLWTTADGRKTGRHPANGGNKDAKRWQAVWTDPDGNEKTRTFHKKTDAIAHGRKMEADAERGEYIDPKAGSEKLGPLARKHLGLNRNIGAGTRRQYESALKNHVEPAFGGRPVKGIKPSEIAEWLNGPLSSYSAGIQQTAFLLLRGALDLAVADKLRRDNPARSPVVRPPGSADPKPRAVWDAETVWKVIDAHPDQYRAMLACEAGLGLRQGEAFAFAEEDIDFDAMTVTVRRQVMRADGHDCFKLPKYGKERTVPMSRGVAAYLRAHIGKYPPQPYTLPWMPEKSTMAAGAHTCRLLFRWHGSSARTDGRHIATANFDKSVWYPALSRAGVGPAPAAEGRRYRTPGREFGSHMLRHVFETMLDNGGVSLAGMVEFMGHSRKGQVITISVYSHVTDETFERARQAVDGTLFRLRPATSGGTVTELRAAR
jgi:integrase